MMTIEAYDMHYKTLNEKVKKTKDKKVVIDKCFGQRFIGAASSGKEITINGTPGNALGCYLDGSDIIVNGNTQDATGDTMNDGRIIVYGNCGDATGYGMRGGEIYIHGNSGYRSGIHMKSYQDKMPVVVIGGSAGSFLGEYQAGGLIIVLGMNTDSDGIVGNFCGTGMHGGKIFLRCKKEALPKSMPAQVVARTAEEKDLKDISAYIDKYAKFFNEDKKDILSGDFVVIGPNTANPYKKLYTHV